MTKEQIQQAAQLLSRSKHAAAFTGAGMSSESGIPPFRGENGLWNQYDPRSLDLSYFHQHPLDSWRVIREIFYEHFRKSKPHEGHYALAWMEEKGFLKSLTTQNIDNLHYEAGSKNVFEFHGNSRYLVCTSCSEKEKASGTDLTVIPPCCASCGGLLKPDFIFFGEQIPTGAFQGAHQAASVADVYLVIGTTGEVMPANQMPLIAKSAGAVIIEVNTVPSLFTDNVSDIFIQGMAGNVLSRIKSLLENE